MRKQTHASAIEIAEMVAELKHLMRNDDDPPTFTMPSMLKEVPSFSSTDSVPLGEMIGRAELGRRSR